MADLHTLAAIDKRMEFDDVAWERNEDLDYKWEEKFNNQDVYREIAREILRWRDGEPAELLEPRRGAANAVLQLKFRDASSTLIRFASPVASGPPAEKVLREVEVMRFLERHTTILVPRILHHGLIEESPRGLGPFIVMEYVPHKSTFMEPLNTPGLSIVDDRCVLNPGIAEEILESAYGQMADVILQLSKHSFTQIGCISQAVYGELSDDWIVQHRPLTFNMSQLIQMGNVPQQRIPTRPFRTSSSYYQKLAYMHMQHLFYQRNDAIDSAEDCKRKYIARCLFRKITRDYKLCDLDSGPFKLVCDDLRPGNVLADDGYKLVAAIDWEFTYAAPIEFAYCPPFWLILEKPEYWKEGLDDWTETYGRRLKTFLKMMKEREDAAINLGELTEEDRLSEHMRRSWESGDFWLNYTARKSWSFDLIYWAKIDKRFFGNGDMEDRIKLLTKKERDNMDGFIQRKLAEKEERRLVDWIAMEAAHSDIEREKLMEMH